MSKTKRDFKRVLAISDLHCGHDAGLTPPEWQKRDPNSKFTKTQADLWNAFSEMVEELKPIDILFVLGDSIDGKGEFSGGTEQMLMDRIKQCDMAAACIKSIGANDIFMVHGTPYHSGKAEDWEALVADKVGAKISGQEFVRVNGVMFDLKHKVGGSGVPYTRSQSIEKDRMWNEKWAKRGQQPRADILIRGHNHWFKQSGDLDGLNINMPSLQGHGSKYGVRQCSGTVDFGVVHFDINEKGVYTWKEHLALLESQKSSHVEL